MSAGLIIVFTLILAVIFIWKAIKSGSNKEAGSVKNGTPAPGVTGDVDTNITEPSNDLWWSRIDIWEQLQLALLLSQKALPVWEIYTGTNETTYRNSSTGPVIQIDNQLLQRSLKEIAGYAQLSVPGCSMQNIEQCYRGFVDPVIAMQDGNWPVTYPVKKIFLSVYNILKSILERSNTHVMTGLLTTSISQSLDCLDMSKLYTSKEIEELLELFKSKIRS